MAGHLRKKELVYIDGCYWLKPGLDLEFRTKKLRKIMVDCVVLIS